MEPASFAAPKSLKSPFHKAFELLSRQRRAALRMRREGDVYLFDASGTIGRAAIMDHSAVGIRLSGAESNCYDRLRYILIMHTGVAHRAELVWEHDGQAGFRVARLNMRGPAPDKGTEDLRAIWRRRRI